MRERMTVRAMPSMGMFNLGKQAVIDERALWRADDIITDLGGRLVKRPGLQQWGYALTVPDATGSELAYTELFNDISQFNVLDNSSGNISYEIARSRLSMETTGLAAGTYDMQVRRMAQASDGTNDSTGGLEMSYRFLMRSRGSFPADPGSGNDYGPSVIIRCNTSAAAQVAFFADGIYYRNGAGAFVAIAGTDVDDGRWHVIELRLTDASMDVYLDDVSVATGLTVGTVATGGAVNANQITFRARTSATTLYAVEYDFVQARSDASAPFAAADIAEIVDWRSNDPVRKQLFAVAGNTIYVDTDHLGVFTGLASTFGSGLTLLVPYLDKIVFMHENSSMRTWDGVNAPAYISSAPRGVVGTEHLGRLFVTTGGLRVYFSEVNDLSDWTTEKSGNFQTSGYFDIPDRRGERVTAMLGNHYGDLFIWTNTSCFRISGTFVNPNTDYRVDNISTSIGCVGPRAVTRVSNDVVFASKQGFHSLQTTLNYGDFEETFLSSAIKNRWNPRPESTGVSTIRPAYETSVRHVPELDLTFISVQLDSDSGLDHLLVFNHQTKQWSGPLSVPAHGMDYVLLSEPPYPVLMTGGSDGKVATLDGDVKWDFGASAYTASIESARISGRSLDPALNEIVKNWKELRLFVLPRGDWNITITYDNDELAGDTITTGVFDAPLNQNKYSRDCLDNTSQYVAVLDQSRLASAETIAVIVVPLDLPPGRWFKFTIEQANAGEDMDLLGFEVDFIPTKSVKENS